MLVAYDSAALNFTLDTFTKTVFSWLRKKAKHKGIIDVALKAHPGGATFIQRFGSAKKTHKWLENLVQDQQLGDDCSEQHDLLFACYTASVRYQTALGPDIGRPLLRDFGEQPQGKKRIERSAP